MPTVAKIKESIQMAGMAQPLTNWRDTSVTLSWWEQGDVHPLHSYAYSRLPFLPPAFHSFSVTSQDTQIKEGKRWAIQLYALQRMASVTQFRSTSFFLQIIMSLLVEIRWGYCRWDGAPHTGCLGATSTNHFTLCQCVACSSPFPLTEWIKDLKHP